MIPLIDTHQHLIYPDRLGYRWTANEPALAGRSFTLEDYHGLARGAVAGTIFMECDVDEGQHEAEVEVVAGLAAAPGSGILGIIAACRPERDEGFAEFLAAARGKGVVGFRRILHVVPDDVSQSETFRANVRRIGAAGFPFDLCLLARQLPIGRDLVRACPDVTFVLDHCGVPDIVGGGLDPWREHIAALAAEPNVVAKISGVLAYCPPDAATLATIRPYVDHVLACFGPDRCLWGSDWPVVNVTASLPAWLAATREILAALPEPAAHAVAHATAERVYGVSVPSRD